MYILPKAIYRFSAICDKIPIAFFTEIEKAILKFVWKHRRPQIGNSIMKKNNKAKGITLPYFKPDYKNVSK